MTKLSCPDSSVESKDKPASQILNERKIAKPIVHPEFELWAYDGHAGFFPNLVSHLQANSRKRAESKSAEL